MAGTSFSESNELTVKVWAKKLFVESLKQTILDKFIGTSADSAIVVKDELSKMAGDRIRYGLRMQLAGDGVRGDSTLEGNEEALTTFTDAVFIDQLRHAVKVIGNMSQQRVTFDIRSEAQSGLVDWWADRFDTSLMNQMTGNVGQSDQRYSGLNAVSDFYGGGNAGLSNGNPVPLEARGILGGNNTVLGTVAQNSAWTAYEDTLKGLGASDNTHNFNLSMLDAAVVKARTLSTPIRPIKMNGMECYVAILHPYQVLDLRRNTSTGQWLDIQKSALMGGQIANNPIFTGAVGMYNGVIIHEDARVPYSGNASDSATKLTTPTTGTSKEQIARGVFFGAQAGCIAFGRNYGYAGSNVKYKWTEVVDDYENQLGVSAALVYGIKKSVFNSKDFASLALSSRSTGEATNYAVPAPS